MFTLYVDSLIPKEVEKYNDAFFDLHLGDVDFTSPNVVNLIREIDGVSYVDNHRITSKFDKIRKKRTFTHSLMEEMNVLVSFFSSFLGLIRLDILDSV